MLAASPRQWARPRQQRPRTRRRLPPGMRRPPLTAQPSISATAQVAGERRYLTVMFCDLVGSTSISAQLDAEDWRDLVGAYLDAASAAVTRDGRPCRQEARRRDDGAVRLSARAGERRRARGARRARDPARARRTQPQECRTGKPGTRRPHRPRDRAGGGRCRRRGVRRRANVAARVQALAEPGAVLVTAQGAAPGRRPVRRRGARRA